MTVAISPEVEAIIIKKINAGLFGSPEEAVATAILRLDELDREDAITRRNTLKAELRAALEEARSGQSRYIGVDEFLIESRHIRESI